MEASVLDQAVPAPPRAGLLRLRSDEALVALFRAGREEAFEAIVSRYEDKLLGYARHVLRGSDEAQDVVQDVFMRAHGALLRDDREMNLKPWLYRILHNRCMDVLRRPTPLSTDDSPIEEAAPVDTAAEAQRRADLQTLVADIAHLPAQQRSALVIRELEGLSYEQLAAALDTTVPAVKSLLVRARMGLAEAGEARALPCADARAAIAATGRPTALVRRHLALCPDCRAERDALRPPRQRRAAAAFLPLLVVGPLQHVMRWLGLAPGGGPDSMVGTATASAVPKAVAAVASVAALGGAVAATPPVHHALRPQPQVATTHAAPALAAPTRTPTPAAARAATPAPAPAAASAPVDAAGSPAATQDAPAADPARADAPPAAATATPVPAAATPAGTSTSAASLPPAADPATLATSATQTPLAQAATAPAASTGAGSGSTASGTGSGNATNGPGTTGTSETGSGAATSGSGTSGSSGPSSQPAR